MKKALIIFVALALIMGLVFFSSTGDREDKLTARLADDGLALLEADGKYGIRTAGGTVLLGAEYDEIANYMYGCAVVTRGGKTGTADGMTGLVDLAGNTLIPFTANTNMYFMDDLVLFREPDSVFSAMSELSRWRYDGIDAQLIVVKHFDGWQLRGLTGGAYVLTEEEFSGASARSYWEKTHLIAQREEYIINVDFTPVDYRSLLDTQETEDPADPDAEADAEDEADDAEAKKRNERAPIVFEDVDANAYYAAAVYWAARNGVTNGKREDKTTGQVWFMPADTVTRGEAVTFLWRAFGKPEPRTAENPFPDMTQDYYREAVLWAVENGITNGTKWDEDSGIYAFSPDATVTRGQMLTLLWRAEGRPGYDGDGLGGYADAEDWARRTGALGGIADSYDRDDACPRSDVVYYLFNAVSRAG